VIAPNALFRDDDRANHPLLVEMKFVDTDDSVISIRLAERPSMIHDVPPA
jgi:hypothetical protein